MKKLVLSPYCQHFYQSEKGFHSIQNQSVLRTPLAFSQYNTQMAISKSFRKDQYLDQMFQETFSFPP